jgi:inner membrane protein
MASLGHVAVGLAAARVYGGGHRPSWRSAAAWSALSMLPDVDVIGFPLGVKYQDPWGHRGATHSFAFAVVVGVAAGLIGRWFKRPAWRTTLFATVVLATHPILDTMTDGGLGCALFWPLDLTRYFGPWRPIQVAPIGLAFLSPYGAIVATSEIVLFLPLFVFALRTSDFRLQTSNLRERVPTVAGSRLVSRFDRSASRGDGRRNSSRSDRIFAWFFRTALRRRGRGPVANAGAPAIGRAARRRLDVSAPGRIAGKRERRGRNSLRSRSLPERSRVGGVSSRSV